MELDAQNAPEVEPASLQASQPARDGQPATQTASQPASQEEVDQGGPAVDM